MFKWDVIQGIYIHIPFCLQKCAYCDFTSFPKCGQEVMEAYTKRLCQEILTYKATLPVNAKATIYMGGGTPSILPINLLTQIVTALKEGELWQQPTEATVEVNPGTVDGEKLVALRELGFDRISMGVQSLQDEELRAMGRVHTAKEALEALRLAKEAGFTRRNADLIYGYPGQTKDTVSASLRSLLEAEIEHISVYSLSVEEGTPLAYALKEGRVVLPEEDEVGDMYDWLTTNLPAKGYARYEISNYSKEGQQSLHNLVYWHYLPYLGFGLGATGFNGRARYTNPFTIEEYLRGGTPCEEKLSLAMQQSEAIFMGLRLTRGINMKELGERFQFNWREKYGQLIKELEDLQLVELTGKENLRLTTRGMSVGNLVFEKFL